MSELLPNETHASPVCTGNLVLKTRVAVLIRNLEEVQKALASVRQRRADLVRLLRFPENVDTQVRTFRRWLELAANAFNEGSPRRMGMDVTVTTFNEDSLAQLGTGLAGLGQVLAALETRVEDMEEPLNRLQPSTLLERELEKTEEVARAVHESLEKELRRRFGEKFENLTALQTNVQSARVTPVEPADALQQAWAKYTDELYESSEALFAEYVDLVGGVAIRDTGFDRGICRIAEDLLKPLRTIGSFTWNSMTIPARNEAVSVTAARVVRLGFPEWSIWTLPLAAYELGNDFVDVEREVAEFIATRPEGESSQILVCMADAFATYFMGPAYACPALLMRLNPAAALADDALVAKRAAAILLVLMRMSRAERPDENLYGPITVRLACEWQAALEQTLGRHDGAGPPAAVEVPVLGEEPGWPSADDLAAIARWTWLDTDGLGQVVAWVRGFDKHMFGRMLDLALWPMVQRWARRLRSEQEVDPLELRRNQLRYLLNAAWRARIAVLDGEEDVDDLELLRRIGDTGERLLLTLLDQEEDSETGNIQRLPARPVQIPGRREDAAAHRAGHSANRRLGNS